LRNDQDAVRYFFLPAATPLRSHVTLVTLALATATGTEAGRAHHAVHVKDNLRKVRVSFVRSVCLVS